MLRAELDVQPGVRGPLALRHAGAAPVSKTLRCKMRVISKDLLMDAAQVVFNPKDTNTFASASLDRTVKVGLLHAHKAGHASSLQGSNNISCVTP